jgi:hypothetical protein
MVTEGTVYADTQWKLITDGIIDVGVTDQVWTQNYSANSISGGTSNVIVLTNANITISSAGTSNVLIVSNTGAYVTGVVSATGNVTGNYILGNGSQLTGLPATYGNANVADYLPTYTGNLTANIISTTGNITGANLATGGTASATGNITGGNLFTGGIISATGNVTGNYILGNGSQLTGLPESYGNANVAAYLPTYTGNLSPGNLTTGGLISAVGNLTAGNVSATNLTGTLATAAQTNITSVGTLTSLSVTGNVQGGNLQTAGLISATGGITGNTLLAGGISLTGNAITSTNATITIDPNSAGGVDGAVIIAGNLSVQGNVTYIDSNVITTNEKSITLANNVNTGTAADGAGIDVGNNNLAFWRFNNATTSWQSNIGLTPVANATLDLGGGSNYWGTLYANAASVGGNVSVGNLSTAGNVTGAYILGNGSQLTGISGGNSFSPIVVSGQSNVTANSSATALTYVAGYGVLLSTDNSAKSITYALDPFAIGGSFGTVTESVTSTMDLGLVTGAVTVSYDLGTASSVDFNSVSSNITPSANATYNLGNATNQWQDLYLSGNVSAANLTGTLLTAAQPNITSIGTLSSLSVSGNVQGGNLRTAGLISATGSITGASVVGGIMTGSSVSVTGAVSGASVVGGIMTGTSLSASGNVTGGNVLTGGLISATGNVQSGNLRTAGLISATGNIQGNFILGNGSQLTGVTAGITTGKSLAITLIMGG